jgi:hypothetical protein
VKPDQVETTGPPPEKVRRFLASLERMKRNLHTIVGDAKGLPPITSALGVWNGIFEAVSKQHDRIDYIDFESITITQKMVTVVMVLPSVEAGQVMEDALKPLPFLKEMKLAGWKGTPISNTPNFQRIAFSFTQKAD